MATGIPPGPRSIPARAGIDPGHSQAGGRRVGLSPHGRGKLSHYRLSHFLAGSIPARAGETNPAPTGLAMPGVYPRTGGGNSAGSGSAVGLGGLSPHGRGKHEDMLGDGLNAGSIPARAGETGGQVPAQCPVAVYPRTGGGNRQWQLGYRRGHGLSPHGRGKRLACSGAARRAGSIPARAGETLSPGLAVLAFRVYPRTGGGNSGPS